ncbi:MAG: acetyl-CoA C-acetyltransferase [Firmicutes bacterium]|jgi:acetyl-CoA C-acetyltransferase|nr:acetyl-CoA C-acetyltransferase [Bacillota bacterium]
MKEVVITSAARTAIGSFGGALAGLPAWQLGAVVIQEVIRRSRIEPGQVDEVLMGSILPASQGANPARRASLAAGVPVEIPAVTINMMCASGLKTVAMAATAIAAGDMEIAVAGGMESMSNAAYFLDRARWGMRMGHEVLKDEMLTAALWCPFTDVHMGMTAENIAEKHRITRLEQDEFAASSQAKAQAAMEAGKFDAEIVPVEIPQKKGEPVKFVRDEYPRSGVTVESLAKLKPAFKKDGTITPGNASGINDGAAACVVMSADKAKELGIKPMVAVRSYASAGVEPAFMGLGPVPATRRALAKIGMSLDGIDLIEANEAFAAQTLGVGRELQWDPSKVNIRGGAIALGHPVGASGARILVTLIHALIDEGLHTGLATLCVGGGMGMSMIVDRA